MQFRVEDWSIVPGPPSVRPPFDSLSLEDIATYSPEEVAAAVLALPGAELVCDAQPSWWEWRARWSSGEAVIMLEMTLFEAKPALWGGFSLSGTASHPGLVDLYQRLHEALPSAWLHNSDCEIHTAASFMTKWNG